MPTTVQAWVSTCVYACMYACGCKHACEVCVLVLLSEFVHIDDMLGRIALGDKRQTGRVLPAKL